MLLPILLAAGIIVFLFTLAVAGRPTEFSVARTATFAAPVAQVFPHVNTLRLWDAWSPWAKFDPSAKTTFEGPEAGAGAVMAWVGNNKIGEGRMTLVEGRTDESLAFRLDFVKPFRSTSTAEFAFRSVGARTEVTWRMSGRNNFFFKLFGLVMDCEAMVGKNFDEGFANLRKVVEKPA